MSLLMDALKKAEQAKRQAEVGAEPLDLDLGAETPSARVEPQLSGRADKTLPPDLQNRLALLDDDVAEGRRRSAGADDFKMAGATAEGERAAAQNVFAVKAAPSRAGLYWTLGALTLLAVGGLAAYFWWQLQPPDSTLVPPPGALSPPVQPRAAPLSPPAAAVPPAPPAVEPPAVARAPSSTATPQESLPQQPPSTAQRPAARPAAAPERTTTRARLANDAPSSAPPAEASIPIRTGGSRLTVNSDVARAYDSYLSGDLAAARRGYEQALRADPRLADALHGLAAISLREGRPEAADAYYARALEADPTDAQALAGLVALRGQADPGLAESRLKTTLAGQPNAHAAHFALGNLFAQQARWAEAQQSYFRAHTNDPDNPDYLFNLGVSLDQLRQPKLAAQFYQRALAAAASRPAGFDQAQVADRVRELQQ